MVSLRCDFLYVCHRFEACIIYVVVWCVVGLNLMSQFNLDNVTLYCTNPAELDPAALKSVSSLFFLAVTYQLLNDEMQTWTFNLQLNLPTLNPATGCNI